MTPEFEEKFSHRRTIGSRGNMVKVSDTINPLVVDLNLTNWDWAKTIICGVVLVPIRLILLIILIFFLWLYAFFRVTFRHEPSHGTTENELLGYTFGFKLLCWFSGFIVKVKGKLDDPDVSKILVIYPHVSFWDVFVLHGWGHVPCFLAKDALEKTPITCKFTSLM